MGIQPETLSGRVHLWIFRFRAVAGGATITEGIFAWPGMGLLFFSSLQIRDYPVLLAILLLSAFFVISFNLIADGLYAVMDPRIRYT